MRDLANPDELNQLVPAGREVLAGGQAIQVMPLKVGQIPAFLRAVGPLLQPLRADAIDWLGLFTEHGEALLQAVAIATRQPRDWVDGLDADEALALAAAVIEVNADFFTRTVLPRLSGLFDPLGQRAPQGTAAAPPAGSTPSSG